MPEPPAMMAYLRRATLDAHRRLEALPFSAALCHGALPLESFVGHLQAMAHLHAVLEDELPIESEPLLASVWDEGMRRLPALQRDLAYFEDRRISVIAPARQAAIRGAQRLRRRCIQWPSSRLGCVYVLEGSRLGGLKLARWAQACFGLTETTGLAYLRGAGDGTGAHWAAYSQRMNALTLDAEARVALADGALETFESIQAVMERLFPFQPQDLLNDVTPLNPGAEE